MPLVIRAIAENVRQREFQAAIALGYSVGEAIHMGYLAEIEVIALGRDGIMERKL